MGHEVGAGFDFWARRGAPFQPREGAPIEGARRRASQLLKNKQYSCISAVIFSIFNIEGFFSISQKGHPHSNPLHQNLPLRHQLKTAILKSEVDSVVEPKSKLVRRFIASRGNDDANSPDTALPIYPSSGYLSPQIAASMTPTGYSSSISCSPTPTMALSMISDLVATSMPTAGAQDSPLMPASPHLGVHSPIMANAPGRARRRCLEP